MSPELTAVRKARIAKGRKRAKKREADYFQRVIDGVKTPPIDAYTEEKPDE